MRNERFLSFRPKLLTTFSYFSTFLQGPAAVAALAERYNKKEVLLDIATVGEGEIVFFLQSGHKGFAGGGSERGLLTLEESTSDIRIMASY